MNLKNNLKLLYIVENYREGKTLLPNAQTKIVEYPGTMKICFLFMVHVQCKSAGSFSVQFPHSNTQLGGACTTWYITCYGGRGKRM